jgi:hypothetical protein
MKTFDIIKEMLITNGSVLNEGGFWSDLATKAGSKAAVDAAKLQLKNLVSDIVQNGKGLTATAIKNSKVYLEQLEKLSQAAAKSEGHSNWAKYVEKDPAGAKVAMKEITEGMNGEVLDAAIGMNKTIEGTLTIAKTDAKAATTKIGKTPNAAVDAFFRDVKENSKLSTNLQKVRGEATKLKHQTLKQFEKSMERLTKLRNKGTGAQVGGKIKPGSGTVSGVKNGKAFLFTKEQLAKYPGEILHYVVSAKGLKTLLGIGVTVGLIYWIYQSLNPNSLIVVTDENGNDVQDNGGGEWAPCIKELIDSKEGVVGPDTNGVVSVTVKTTEYPDGVQFYTNGRVLNIKTVAMGTWKCIDGNPTIQAESKRISLKGLLKEQGDDAMANDVDVMIDLLDFPVSGSDLKKAGDVLQKYADNGKGKEFLSLYQQSGLGGGDLTKTLNYIYTSEPQSVQAKGRLKQLNAQILSGKSGGTTPTPVGKLGLSHIKITWDGEKTDTGGGGGGAVKPKVNYHDCSTKDFPFEFGCIAPKIAEIQGCIGVKPQKGYFGPKTLSALKNLEYIKGESVITKEMYDKIKTLPGCGQPIKTDDKKVVAPAPEEKPQPQVPTNGENPDAAGLKKPEVAPEKTPEPSTPQESGEDVYNRLEKQGFFRGRKIGENDRVPYKGGELPGGDVEKLDQFFGDNGYKRFRPAQDGKRYGEKYVWRKP